MRLCPRCKKEHIETTVYCMACKSYSYSFMKKNYQKYKKRALKAKKTYYIKNRLSIRKKQNIYHKQYLKINKNKEKLRIKKWRINNIEHVKKIAALWRKNNKSKINTAARVKRNTDSAYKIMCNLRHRACSVIKTNKTYKNNTTQELLGCSVEELKMHLQSNFKPGMSWDNYGKAGWHIDHIKPCAKFNLLDAEEQKKCFHYTNLQPLWWYENLSKGAKYEENNNIINIAA